MSVDDDLRRTLRALLRASAQPGLVLHVVLETRGAGTGARPVAELWVFACRQPAQLPAALERAAATGDEGFLFDALDALPESPTVVAVDALFPAWPSDIDTSYAALVATLRAELGDATPTPLLHAWASPAGGLRTALLP